MHSKNMLDLNEALRPIKARARKLLHICVPGVTHLSPDDIFLASFPKSGNTFMRFLWANIELDLAGDHRIVHFKELDSAFKTNYEGGETGTYQFRHLPRLVKTHVPRQHLPVSARRVLYLVRHPGDVMVSYHKYMQAHPYNWVRQASLAEFIRHPQYGINSWITHTLSWQNRSTVTLAYENLYGNPLEALQDVFVGLDVDLPATEVVERAVEKSSFRSVQRLEEEYGHEEKFARMFQPGAKFARSGKSGQWKHALSAVDIDYIRARLKKAGLAEYWRDG